MTFTYQNINWWGHPDTWTEPCTVVDSLMLAAELYKATNDEKYRVYAARIYHNGFATLQRIEGGAEAYAEKFTEEDGIKLCPIVKYYKVPEDVIFKSKQQIV